VLAVATGDEDEVYGVNDRAQLAHANAILWERKRQDLMRGGVTLLDPSTTYVMPEVEIESDVVLQPGCHVLGRTRIGSGTEIGPNSYVVDSTVGNECRVWLSVLEGARVGNQVRIGPFSHLRPGAVIEDGAVLGNYAEVKASRIGPGVQMHHFSYIGDSEVGARTNVGAGTITANFDGVDKHRTTIGSDVKIGSDTVFRAPVSVGDGAVTGAGSIVTKDVRPGYVVVGMPARHIRQVRGAHGTNPGGQDG
jgi:bifunctional UDP-N-acetylglucosamine pyrophosphorylase/glucosamine-1-phosphate N-acetyltransferase